MMTLAVKRFIASPKQRELVGHIISSKKGHCLYKGEEIDLIVIVRDEVELIFKQLTLN